MLLTPSFGRLSMKAVTRSLFHHTILVVAGVVNAATPERLYFPAGKAFEAVNDHGVTVYSEDLESGLVVIREEADCVILRADTSWYTCKDKRSLLTLDEAKQLLESPAKSTLSDSLELLRMKALVLGETGDYTGALLCVEEALRHDPHSLPWLRLYIKLCMSAGRYDDALAACNAACSKTRCDGSLLRLRAAIHQVGGDDEAAAADREAAELLPSSDMAPLGQALSAFRHNRIDDQGLLKALTEIVQSGRCEGTALTNRALLYIRMGDRTSAIADLNKALASDPNHPLYLLWLGSLLDQTDESEKALKVALSGCDVPWGPVDGCFGYSLSFDTPAGDISGSCWRTSTALRFLVATLYFERNEYSEALRYCRIALNDEPRQPILLAFAGWSGWRMLRSTPHDRALLLATKTYLRHANEDTGWANSALVNLVTMFLVDCSDLDQLRTILPFVQDALPPTDQSRQRLEAIIRENSAESNAGF